MAPNRLPWARRQLGVVEGAARDQPKPSPRSHGSLARLMDPLEATAIVAAGVAAGAINAVVGSGTLITFPVLIALGYQPLIANVSNNIGLVPGAVTGAYGYRREFEGQRRARGRPRRLLGRRRRSPARRCCSAFPPRRSTRSSRR